MIDLDYITEKCNSLPWVTWDRCVLMDEYDHAVVYGWIDGEKPGRSDFVVIQFWFDEANDDDAHQLSFLTSSALWSPTIYSILLPDIEHNDCQTVQDMLPELHYAVSR